MIDIDMDLSVPLDGYVTHKASMLSKWWLG